MDWALWLAVIALSFVLWWFGFIATKQMRIDKNNERAAKWARMAEEQKKAKEVAAQEPNGEQNS